MNCDESVMKDARFCEMRSQFRCLRDTQKIPGSIGGRFILCPAGWIPGNVHFSLFCKDRSQSEVDQDDHTEDDAVVAEKFEVMFLDVSE